MRPDRFGAVALRRPGQPFGHLIERVVPGYRRERVTARALVADPAQRHRQPVGMVLALGIAGDLGADHPLSVGLALGSAHPADRRLVDALDRERAGARTIMRADAVGGVERQEVLRRRVYRRI